MLFAERRFERDAVVAGYLICLVVDKPLEVVVIRMVGRDGYRDFIAQFDIFRRSGKRQRYRNFYINGHCGYAFTAGFCNYAFYGVCCCGFGRGGYACSCRSAQACGRHPYVGVGTACG
jgi:hypothetical protein